MQIVIGSDHGGFELKENLKKYLLDEGYSVKDFGTYSKVACDYPDFAYLVAEAVARGEYEFGIMIDGSGVASAIVANKVPGIRATACNEVFVAYSARSHNNSNVLCIGAGVVGLNKAKMIVKTFLTTPYEGGRHQIRLDKIRNIELKFLK